MRKLALKNSFAENFYSICNNLFYKNNFFFYQNLEHKNICLKKIISINKLIYKLFKTLIKFFLNFSK